MNLSGICENELRIIHCPQKSESESHSVMSDSLWPPGLYSPWNFLGQNTRVGSLSLLQGIFPTQGSNPDPLHCREILTVRATREIINNLCLSQIIIFPMKIS